MNEILEGLRGELAEAEAMLTEARVAFRDEPVVQSQRGGGRPSPWHYILRDREHHYRSIVAMIERIQKAHPFKPGDPVDDKLEALLD
jgi:hypothetical protein